MVRVYHDFSSIMKETNMRLIGIGLAALLTVGCVQQEGFRFGTSEFGVEEIVEQRELRDRSGNQYSEDVPSDLVLIGTVSAFRPLTDKNTQDIYAKYLAFSKQIHPDTPPDYSQEEFRDKFAGWTALKTMTIPLVMGNYDYALVPTGMEQAIQFPSSFGTFMIQETGDLLAARINSDGYFIVKQVLCRDGNGYTDCAKNYHKGLFDGRTGKELHTKKLTPMDSGKRIDPKTFTKFVL